MPGEKTEQPTDKKLRESRKKGQVSKSNDLTQAFLFLTAAATLSLGGHAYVIEIQRLLRDVLRPELLTGDLEPVQMLDLFGQAMVKSLLLSAPLLVALATMAAALNFVQVRGLFAPEVVKPKL